jgi:hypothetical protein
MSLATVSSDDDLRRQLLNAGLVAEADFRKVDLSGSKLFDVLAPGVSSNSLSDFIRDYTVESLYRIRRPGRGAFDFVVDLAPRYPTGVSLDPEMMMADADRRASEWDEIESVLPDLHKPLRMAPRLEGVDTVAVSPSTWRILAALGSGVSTSQVARELGLTDFAAAQEISGLIRNDLVVISTGPSIAPPIEEVEDVAAPEVVPVPEVADEQVTEPVAESEPELETVEAPVAEATEPIEEPALQAAETPAETPVDDGARSWESQEIAATETAVEEQPEWSVPLGADAAEPAAEVSSDPWSGWSQPEDARSEWAEQPAESAAEAPAAEVEETPAVAADDRTGGWWSQAMGEPEAPAGKDTDADKFLESVFSSLSEEDAKEQEDETGFGLGLLRRRRMGAAARDLSDNES